MNKIKPLILCAIAVLLLVLAGIYLFNLNRKWSLVAPIAQKLTKEAVPSESLTQYSDPAGFTLNYPDNLSIVKKDIEDQSTYADLQLSSKDVSGSLSLKIIDSKFSSLDQWVKSETSDPKNSKEVKLGNLKAEEIRLSDRLILGALDQGILFTIEVPLVEEKFWSEVYESVLANFSFAAPEAATNGSPSSSDDVSFEGEEVVE